MGNRLSQESEKIVRLTGKSDEAAVQHRAAQPTGDQTVATGISGYSSPEKSSTPFEEFTEFHKQAVSKQHSKILAAGTAVMNFPFSTTAEPLALEPQDAIDQAVEKALSNFPVLSIHQPCSSCQSWPQ